MHIGFTAETYAAIKSCLAKNPDLHPVVICDTFDLFAAGTMNELQPFCNDDNLLIAIVIEGEGTIQTLHERVLQAQCCNFFSEVFVAITDDDLFDLLCAIVPAFCVTEDEGVVGICNSVYVQTATRKKSPQTSKEYLIHRIKSRDL